MWPIIRMVSICLTGAFLAAPSSAQVQRSTPELTARIEGPQVPNRQGYDPYTIAQIMKMTNVPGVSVAVIQDFSIHWAKAYGVADAKSESPVTTEIEARVAAAYGWDSLDKPIPR